MKNDSAAHTSRTAEMSPAQPCKPEKPMLKMLPVLILLAVTCLAPLLIYPVFAMKLMCFAIFAYSFNFLFSYAGLLSFGHAAYFGAASYFAGYAAKHWGFSPEAAIIFAVAGSTCLGVVFGAVSVRRQGIYFAMTTLALAQLVYFFSLQNPVLTGGEDGIQGIYRGDLFGIIDLRNEMTMYYFVAIIFLAGVFAMGRIVDSPFGQILKSIRDNEQRAISLGYNTGRYKLVAFVISAAFAGLAGATKVLVVQVATLTDVHVSMHSEPILMTLVGGAGTFFGPLVGAAVIVSMQEYLAPLGSWVLVAQGVILVTCVMLFKRGIVGMFTKQH